jgi:hypothetical protein
MLELAPFAPPAHCQWITLRPRLAGDEPLAPLTPLLKFIRNKKFIRSHAKATFCSYRNFMKFADEHGASGASHGWRGFRMHHFFGLHHLAWCKDLNLLVQTARERDQGARQCAVNMEVANTKYQGLLPPESLTQGIFWHIDQTPRIEHGVGTLLANPSAPPKI